MNKRALATFALALLVAVVPLSAQSSGTPIYLDPPLLVRRARGRPRVADDARRRRRRRRSPARRRRSRASASAPTAGGTRRCTASRGVQLTNNGNATTLTNTTSYPIDLSLGSSWDPDLIYRVAHARSSDEAREVVPEQHARTSTSTRRR